MGQHNSFGKDMNLLAEAYSSMLGGAHMMQGMGVADQAAAALADEDGYNCPEEAAEEHDKTGHLSDEDLLAKVKDEGTAGKGLLDAAKARVGRGESLTPDERDALARDDYEGNEGSDEGTEKKPGDWSGKGGYYDQM